MSSELDAVIGALPDGHADVLRLRFVDDLELAEIAELLEIPVGTVMSRLYRARKALVQAMGGTR